MTKQLFAQRMQRKAVEARSDRLSEIRAERHINEVMYESRKQQLADEEEYLENLTVPQLMAWYGWMSPAELEKRAARYKEWMARMGVIFVENIGRKTDEKGN